MQAKAFQSVPVLALTATATDKVKEDVTNILRISGCPVFNVNSKLPSSAPSDALSWWSVGVTAGFTRLLTCNCSVHLD